MNKWWWAAGGFAVGLVVAPKVLSWLPFRVPQLNGR